MTKPPSCQGRSIDAGSALAGCCVFTIREISAVYFLPRSSGHRSNLRSCVIRNRTRRFRDGDAVPLELIIGGVTSAASLARLLAGFSVTEVVRPRISTSQELYITCLRRARPYIDRRNQSSDTLPRTRRSSGTSAESSSIGNYVAD